MSIAGDLLTAATPARLLCRRGTWMLELVKLVPVDRNVFQPRVQRLEGSEAVLQHLKRSADNPGLATAAGQLMRGFRTDEDRCFEAVDGDWVPGEPGPRRDSTRPSAPPPGGSVSGEVAELRAELLVLRASHERLRERIMRLESLMSSGSAPPRDLISVVPTPSVVLPQVSDVPRGPAPFAATLAQGEALRASEALRPRSVEPSPSPTPATPAVRLPAASEIGACLQTLVGDQISVREKRPFTFSVASAEPRWVSRLIDDDGREVGAIVADLHATTALGGALMSLDKAEVEAQRAAGTPSEDVLGAMSEVANNLSGVINQGSRSVHVRVKPIEPLSPEVLEWAKSRAIGLGLALEPNGGCLFLLARGE
jgi:hypothetical protein